MPALSFTFDPADSARLARWPGMRPSRAFPVELVWHDTAGADLQQDALTISSQAGLWQLARLHPVMAAVPSPILAETRRPELLGHHVPSELLPQARLLGKRQTLQWTQGEAGSEQAAELRVLEGRLSARPEPAICHLTLQGPASAIGPLAVALAGELRLQVPRAGLAEQALAAATGTAPTPRALGAPHVPDGQTVAESLATIAGHLLDVMLHWADRVKPACTPEPVHQMRVATRRLRSALSVYKNAAACAELAGLMVPLKLCAARLGTVRDWDVFLDGTGARLAATFPGDKRCAAMLGAASRRRRAAYAELGVFLASADFRTLTVALACAAALRPWDGAAPAEGLQQDTAVFAATVLTKRWRQVRKAGRKLDTLTVPALHELRKDCKRLRYAAEFFAPLFPAKRAKRFLAQLAELQEELGLLNDGAAVSGLMAQLGRLERSYAAGLVEGFSAAHAGPARVRITQAWKRFRAAKVFWPA